MRREIFVLAAVAALLLGPAAATADDAETPMNRVSFLVERSRDVDNDWVTAVLALTDDDVDSAKLANRINQTMTWALGVARGHKDLRVKSGGYSTHPVYGDTDRRIRAWRATQQLVLEGDSAEKVSAAVGELQGRLQLQSMRFSVSPVLRRLTQDELIAESLSAFRARAELVRTSLGKSGYALVSISINTGGSVMPVARFERSRAMAASVAPPAMEAGTSQVSVGVNGTIELE
jgi:predicted secreted protein